MRWAAWEGFEQRRDRILVLMGSLRLRTENGRWGDEGGGACTDVSGPGPGRWWGR